MLIINLALVMAAVSASYVPNYFKLVLPPTKDSIDPDGRKQPHQVYHPYESQFDPAPVAATDSAASTESTESAGSASQSTSNGSASTGSNATSSSNSPSSTTHRGGAVTAGMFAAPFAAALLLL